MEVNSVGWISIGIVLVIFALICWIFWRKLFKKPALAPETKEENKKEEKKEPVALRSKSKAATVFFLLLISVALMIAHQIYTDRRELAKSTKIQAKFRPLAGTFEVPAGSGQYSPQTIEAFFKKDQRVWFGSKSKTLAILWDGKEKRKIEIPHHGTVKRCTKTDYIIFIKQAQPTQVSYKILSG